MRNGAAMRNGTATPPCPVCATQALFYCRRQQARYFLCRACGTIFQDPMPTIEAMRAYVDEEYAVGAYEAYVRARKIKLLTFAERAARIRRHAGSGRLLDVGASCGYFVEAALEAGFDAHGLELSPVAVAAAPEVVRDRLAVGDVNRLRHDGVEPYDVVTAFDILEHTFDPMQFLADLRSVSRDGGLLVITTPDTGHVLRYAMGRSWPMLQPSQHTVLFSRKSLRMALSKAGYTDIVLTAARKVLTPDYLAEQVGVHNPLLARAYATVAPAVPKVLRDMPIGVNIGETMAFARCQR